MTKTEKELSFLYLATAFTNMYINESKAPRVKIVDDLLLTLGKRSKMFLSKAKKVTAESLKIFDECEQELRKPKKNRFEQKAVADDNGHFSAHGLLFAVSLILEHKELKNKSIFLPYKIAEDIYKDFEGIENQNVKNSRILAKYYADRVRQL